jgi:hypothetical protein
MSQEDERDVDRVVAALEQQDLKVVGPKSGANGDTWQAQCPAHDDRTPSLAVTDNGSRALLHCFAGCDLDDILKALELSKSASHN